MTAKEKIAYILQPELLELRAPAGGEWVLNFCTSLLARLDRGEELSERMMHTLDKTYREAALTAEWVDKMRATPAPAATFEALCTPDLIEQLRPHVVHAIRQGVAS
jgi:hypothetical protein